MPSVSLLSFKTPELRDSYYRGLGKLRRQRIQNLRVLDATKDQITRDSLPGGEVGRSADRKPAVQRSSGVTFRDRKFRTDHQRSSYKTEVFV